MKQRDFAASGDDPKFPVPPEGTSEPTQARPRVAWTSHPDPLCQHRDFPSLELGGVENAYELRGHDADLSLVAHILGFVRSEARIARAIDYVRPQPGISFELPEHVDPEAIAAKINHIMHGSVSGHTSTVIALNGYHGAAQTIFSAIHKAVGAPRCALAPQEHGAGGGDLFEAARAVSPAVHEATRRTLEIEAQSEKPKERFDRNQKSGPYVVFQEAQSPVCVKCGGEMIDSSEGKVCKMWLEQEASLRGDVEAQELERASDEMA